MMADSALAVAPRLPSDETLRRAVDHLAALAATAPRSAACDHPCWRLRDDGDFECVDCGLIEGPEGDE